MTSQKSVADKYKCAECKDTGWIKVTEGNYRQCGHVDIERVHRLWESFGIKSEEVKKLSEYEPFDEITKSARDKAIRYIKNFNLMKEIRENSYGLFGQPGAGKSHIVISIGAALLNRKESPIQVIYMPYLEVMRELKANSMDEEYYNKLINRYCRAQLLIIDDLFKDKLKNGQLVRNKYGEVVGLNEADMKHIYPIINYRYLNHLPILISTECTPKMLVELDEALAGRIIESCGENITVFNNIKYNYRLRKYIK